MNGINDALWEFPCEHNFKVMGSAQAPMIDIVTTIVRRHAPDFDASRISVRASRTGKYHSVTAVVYVTHKDQLEGIYRELSAHEAVAWTL